MVMTWLVLHLLETARRIMSYPSSPWAHFHVVGMLRFMFIT